MIGEDLLVAPIVKPDITSRLVYLPKGIWYDFWTNRKYEGGTMIRAEAPLETVPMFVRGGAIIPLAPEMKFVGEKPMDPITFAIYPDEKGSASTTLYEDDGLTPDYLRGVSRRTTVEVKRAAGGYLASVDVPNAQFHPGARRFSFVIKSSPATRVVAVADNGRSQRIEIK
jgi:alpha-glucosidase